MKEWLIETIAKRAIPRAIAGVIGLLVAKGIVAKLATWGVNIDIQKFQTEITALALIGADVALRHVKQGAQKVIKPDGAPPEGMV